MLACRPLTPGVTIGVVKDGKILMAKGYGVADVSTNRPVTNETLFEIASMSKAFGATLLMKQIGRSVKYAHLFRMLFIRYKKTL